MYLAGKLTSRGSQQKRAFRGSQWRQCRLRVGDYPKHRELFQIYHRELRTWQQLLAGGGGRLKGGLAKTVYERKHGQGWKGGFIEIDSWKRRSDGIRWLGKVNGIFWHNSYGLGSTIYIFWNSRSLWRDIINQGNMWALGEISAKNWDSLSENQVTGKGRVIVFLRYKALKNKFRTVISCIGPHLYFWKNYMYGCVCAYMAVYLCTSYCPQRPEQSVWSPGAGVIDNHELSCECWELKQVPWKSCRGS